MILLSATSAALAAFGLWGFYTSFAPVPSKLDTFIGTAAEIRTHTTLYSKSHATFQLRNTNGDVIEFAYTPFFKRFFYFAEHVKDGMTVEVTTGPGGRQDFWGLKLGSQTLMTPTEARDARLTDGRWGLAIFVGFFLNAVWAAREGLSFQQKGN